jgi:hypothetical protein
MSLVMGLLIGSWVVTNLGYNALKDGYAAQVVEVSQLQKQDDYFIKETVDRSSKHRQYAFQLDNQTHRVIDGVQTEVVIHEDDSQSPRVIITRAKGQMSPWWWTVDSWILKAEFYVPTGSVVRPEPVTPEPPTEGQLSLR